MSYSEAMGVGLRCWWPVFSTRIITGLIITLGYLALFVPGIIFGLRYAIVDSVVVLEGLSGGQARQRSRQLSQCYALQIFGVGVLYLVYCFAQVAIVTTLFMTMSIPHSIISATLFDCLRDVIAPFATIAIFLIYREAAAIEAHDTIPSGSFLMETERSV